MADPPPPADDRVPYTVFGERFFEHAVSEERIVGGFDGLAGNRIEFGPIGAGPGKLAKVSAEGTFGQASAERLDSEEISFRLSIPVALDLYIELVDRHRFDVAVTVGLTLVARAAEPLRVVIDIENRPKRTWTSSSRAMGSARRCCSELAGSTARSAASSRATSAASSKSRTSWPQGTSTSRRGLTGP